MAVIAMPNADAASKFDGTWSAVFRTKSGPCQPAYRGAVQVVDGNMEMAGAGGSLSGRVLSNGSVGYRELRWHINAERRGGLEVDHQIEPLRTLYRQVAWLGTVQDFRDVIPASSEYLDLRSVRKQ